MARASGPKVGAYSFPAPTGGWDSISPLSSMAAKNAISLINMFPDLQSVNSRKGYRRYNQQLFGTIVKSLFEYAAPNGALKLISAAGGHLQESSTVSSTSTDLGGGYSSDIWQGFNFAGAGSNRLLLFNGVDNPRQYDGTVITNAVYTGPADISKLIQGTPFKQRVYLVEAGTTYVWYGLPNEITGVLTKFDVGSYLTKGGGLSFVCSWSRNLNSRSDDVFIIVSTRGEILVYEGSSPDDTDWVLSGRCILGVPLTRRGYVQVGAETILLLDNGAVPLSRIFPLMRYNAQNFDPENNFLRITSSIDTVFKDDATLYGTNFGWDIVSYSPGKMIIVNVPVAPGLYSKQWVMNSISGAWCQFTGINASCWCVFDKRVFFGGLDGWVYQADYGLNDSNNAMTIDLATAFNTCGNNLLNKRFTMAKPVVIGSTALTFGLGISVDYQTVPAIDSVSTTIDDVAVWDSAIWDSAVWAGDGVHSRDWYSVSGLGVSASVHLNATIKNVSLSLNQIEVMFETGGLL